MTRSEMPTDKDPVSVLLGDCLEELRSMPDQCVDIVVTSPPYNQLGSRIPAEGSGMFKGKTFLKGVTENGYADDMDEDVYQAWLSDVISECLRVSKGLVWVNHKIRYREREAIHPLHFLKFPVYSEVVWDRGSSQALNCKKFAPSHELIHAFGTPHYWDDSSNTQFSVWKLAPSRDDSGHPCPYPLAIPRRCIRASCPPGGIVLDPFAGSGTTGAAAIMEGCQAVLFEKDPKYIPIIQRKIDAVLGDDYMIPPQRVVKPKPADDFLINLVR